MLANPKNRSWPSVNVSNFWNIPRHPAGDRNGNRPSRTSTRASAAQKASPSKLLLGGCSVAAAVAEGLEEFR